MSTKLSVNLNKIALLRNSRDNGLPSMQRTGELCIAAGAQGLTLHPRPDQRHVRPGDVPIIGALIDDDLELNLEGNPFAGPEDNGYPGFLQIVEAARPHQATLVPDDPGQLTSDHGWDPARAQETLPPIIEQLQSWGCRVSLFVDPDPTHIAPLAALGIERVELYTGPYAEAFATAEQDAVLQRYIDTAEAALEHGLELNAGHDLNQLNLGLLLEQVPGILEVSIGHALITEALEEGLAQTVHNYVEICAAASHKDS